jgi:hypothetical protein
VRHQKCRKSRLFAAHRILFSPFFARNTFARFALQMREWQQSRFCLRVDAQRGTAKQRTAEKDCGSKPECRDVLLKGGRKSLPKQGEQPTDPASFPGFVNFAVGPGDQRFEVSANLRLICECRQASQIGGCLLIQKMKPLQFQ